MGNQPSLPSLTGQQRTTDTRGGANIILPSDNELVESKWPQESDLDVMRPLWNHSVSGNLSRALQYFYDSGGTLTRNYCFMDNDKPPDACLKVRSPAYISEMAPIKSWMRIGGCSESLSQYSSSINKVGSSTSSEGLNSSTPSAGLSGGHCCDGCYLYGHKVDIYHWPEPAADTSCLSIVGNASVHPLDWGATTEAGTNATYWGCSILTRWDNTFSGVPKTWTLQSNYSSAIVTYLGPSGLANKEPVLAKAYVRDPWGPPLPCADGNTTIADGVDPFAQAHPRQRPVKRAPFPTQNSTITNIKMQTGIENGSQRTAVSGTYTFTSPSIYAMFYGIHASDDCGSRGPYIESTMLTFSPGELSTIAGPLKKAQYATETPTRAFNFADLPCPPESVMRENWYKPAPGELYLPLIAMPDQVRNLDPAFVDCTAIQFTGLDPPHTLSPGAAVAAAEPTPVYGMEDPNIPKAAASLNPGPKQTAAIMAPSISDSKDDPSQVAYTNQDPDRSDGPSPSETAKPPTKVLKPQAENVLNQKSSFPAQGQSTSLNIATGIASDNKNPEVASDAVVKDPNHDSPSSDQIFDQPIQPQQQASSAQSQDPSLVNAAGPLAGSRMSNPTFKMGDNVEDLKPTSVTSSNPNVNGPVGNDLPKGDISTSEQKSDPGQGSVWVNGGKVQASIGQDATPKNQGDTNSMAIPSSTKQTSNADSPNQNHGAGSRILDAIQHPDPAAGDTSENDNSSGRPVADPATSFSHSDAAQQAQAMVKSASVGAGGGWLKNILGSSKSQSSGDLGQASNGSPLPVSPGQEEQVNKMSGQQSAAISKADPATGDAGAAGAASQARPTSFPSQNGVGPLDVAPGASGYVGFKQGKPETVSSIPSSQASSFLDGSTHNSITAAQESLPPPSSGALRYGSTASTSSTLSASSAQIVNSTKIDGQVTTYSVSSADKGLSTSQVKTQTNTAVISGSATSEGSLARGVLTYGHGRRKCALTFIFSLLIVSR